MAVPDGSSMRKPVANQTLEPTKNQAVTDTGKPIDTLRRERMLKMLRAAEDQHRRKERRNAAIAIGDLVEILGAGNLGRNARVLDLDYIHSTALVEPADGGPAAWIALNKVALENRS